MVTPNPMLGRTDSLGAIVAASDTAIHLDAPSGHYALCVRDVSPSRPTATRSIFAAAAGAIVE